VTNLAVGPRARRVGCAVSFVVVTPPYRVRLRSGYVTRFRNFLTPPLPQTYVLYGSILDYSFAYVYQHIIFTIIIVLSFSAFQVFRSNLPRNSSSCVTRHHRYRIHITPPPLLPLTIVSRGATQSVSRTRWLGRRSQLATNAPQVGTTLVPNSVFSARAQDEPHRSDAVGCPVVIASPESFS